MKLFEKEQHTVLPKAVQQCIKAANDEDEDDDLDDEEDSDDEHSNLVDSVANPAILKFSRGTVTAPNRSIRLRHNSTAASEEDLRQSLRQTWAAPQLLSTMPTDLELEKCTKRCRRRLNRAPGQLVHALQDAANGCKYFFFGNVPRTTMSFVFIMTCWGFTVYCVAQFLADLWLLDPSNQQTEGTCGDLNLWNWPLYAGIFYANILVVSPLTALLYNTGRRPLFLAALEPKPDEGIGSTELIKRAKAAVRREALKPEARRDGFGHLTTEERNEVGLSRRKAERLVQFVCMTTADRSRVLNTDELAEILATIQIYELLVAFSFVLTTAMVGVDSFVTVDTLGPAGRDVDPGVSKFEWFDWTPADEVGHLRISPCIGVLGCWYCLLLVVCPIGWVIGRAAGVRQPTDPLQLDVFDRIISTAGGDGAELDGSGGGGGIGEDGEDGGGGNAIQPRVEASGVPSAGEDRHGALD